MTLHSRQSFTLFPRHLSLLAQLQRCKKLSIVLLAHLALSTSLTLCADEIKSLPPIARVADAQIFAEYKDKYPTVLNYFTHSSEAEIIAFYQKQYGEVLSQNLKRKRLTLFFTEDNVSIRVVISQQNNKRQVDVLSELIIDKPQS